MTHWDRRRTIGMLYVLGAITAWGAYFPFAKLILLKIAPPVFLIFRFSIGAVVLLLLSRHLGKSFHIQRRDRLHIVVAAFVGVVFHQLFQLTGLQFTSATNTGWILTVIPPVTGLLAWVFLREHIGFRQIIGVIMAMLGVLFLVSKGRLDELSPLKNIGDLLVFASVFTWSGYTVMTRSRLVRYDALPITALHMTIAALVFVVLGLQELESQIGNLGTTDWLIIAGIGLIPSGLAYFWWNAGLARLGSLNTSMFLFIEALVASLVGWMLLGEVFSIPMVIGAVVLILGVTWAQTGKTISSKGQS